MMMLPSEMRLSSTNLEDRPRWPSLHGQVVQFKSPSSKRMSETSAVLSVVHFSPVNNSLMYTSTYCEIWTMNASTYFCIFVLPFQNTIKYNFYHSGTYFFCNTYLEKKIPDSWFATCLSYYISSHINTRQCAVIDTITKHTVLYHYQSVSDTYFIIFGFSQTVSQS